MQILRPYSRSAKSETLAMEPSSSVLKRPLVILMHTEVSEPLLSYMADGCKGVWSLQDWSPFFQLLLDKPRGGICTRLSNAAPRIRKGCWQSKGPRLEQMPGRSCCQSLLESTKDPNFLFQCGHHHTHCYSVCVVIYTHSDERCFGTTPAWERSVLDRPIPLWTLSITRGTGGEECLSPITQPCLS